MPTDRPGRPRLLLIAAFYPPSRASGVFRPLAMGNYFAERGWDVTVITVQEEFFDRVTASRDDSLLTAIHPDVEVVRVPMPIQHLERDLRHFGPLRANFPRLHRKIYRHLQVFDRYSPWLPGVVAEGLRRHVRRRFDLVLATGNPWTSFAAAAALHHATGVPYVLDYRDSWTLNQFTQQPAFPAGHTAYTWEPRVLSRAAAISFVNKGMLDWHARRYPHLADRMMVLENGFDADLLAVDTYRPPAPDRPLRFGYLGTLTDQYDNRIFWQGWKLAQMEPELAGATADIYGHVGFFGVAAASQARGLPDASVPRAVYHGPVAKQDVAATYRDLDVLLFLVPDSPYVTSGKTYEYMATGKPIVAVHTPESAAGEPLRDYPLRATVAEMTPEAVRDALVEGARLARAATRADHVTALAHARRYDRRTLLAPFEERMQATRRSGHVRKGAR
ncbi:glycosyltransferase [Ornithinimicrobium cerasi]|uniref:Glycosyltransferase involved in cell wall bisynthesis n=1 Tax=Ornithinimicrobium cerasi TaxID=2248773 RepID=A0A285VGT8_9MICO|nr:glycosyltransferase [Ornithinimicrobium cerasi]SOC52396.1 Glycosyltransferase involved in cell wall bisynthesis [Ornithinimicrobium cerasi]